LQDYLDRPGIQLFVNLEDGLEEVKRFLAGRPGITRIGTGELADSLALEPWAGLAEKLVPLFRQFPNGILELKTKSDRVGSLLDLAHGNHTVISWSLNPDSVAKAAEAGAPSAARRLEVARKCQERGYPIALHFDPLVMAGNWEEEYRELVERVFEILDPRSILWISLGALRYPPAIHERLLPSGLALGESFPGLDGKMRYLRPLRTAMFRSMARWIRELGGDLFVYLCMESPEVWEDALGWAPRDAADLDRRFQERIGAFWAREGCGDGLPPMSNVDLQMSKE
jgi:spore photoproduct lyase